MHVTRDGRRAHDDDRIDVYLDAFRLDHEIALKDRLPRDADTVPPADVVLIKLQRAAPSHDDLRDVVALLKDLRLDRRDEPGVIDLDYLARLCSRDWCLHHDVTASLRRCREHLAAFDLDVAQQARVAAAVDEVEAAIAGRPKSLRWRLRSLPGERLPWTDGVDEREGQRLAHSKASAEGRLATSRRLGASRDARMSSGVVARGRGAPRRWRPWRPDWEADRGAGTGVGGHHLVPLLGLLAAHRHCLAAAAWSSADSVSPT